MKNKNWRSMGVSGAVAFLVAGCASMEYLPVDRSRPQELQYQLAVGQTVHVRLQNGEHHQFRIVALEPDAIVGRDERIAYRDIDLLEVKVVDYQGPALTALAVGALALVYVAAAVIDSELDEDDGTICNDMGACHPR